MEKCQSSLSKMKTLEQTAAWMVRVHCGTEESFKMIIIIIMMMVIAN